MKWITGLGAAQAAPILGCLTRCTDVDDLDGRVPCYVCVAPHPKDEANEYFGHCLAELKVGTRFVTRRMDLGEAQARLILDVRRVRDDGDQQRRSRACGQC